MKLFQSLKLFLNTLIDTTITTCFISSSLVCGYTFHTIWSSFKCAQQVDQKWINLFDDLKLPYLDCNSIQSIKSVEWIYPDFWQDGCFNVPRLGYFLSLSPSLLLWLRAELFLLINKTLPATFQPALTDQRIRQFWPKRTKLFLVRNTTDCIISRQDTFSSRSWLKLTILQNIYFLSHAV